MSYLVCDECGSYYEIEDDENPDDYNLECDCGGNLEYLKDFPPISNDRDKIVHGTSLTDEKSHSYKILIIFGIFLILAGLIGAITLGFVGYFVIIAGLIFGYYGYKEGYSWIRGAKGEKIVSNYLESLPSGYFIFNDVKIPNGKGNFDHIVVGPTGIFLIETKNYSGNFVIYGDNWKSSYSRRQMRRTPGNQVKQNAFDLRELFYTNKITKGKVWIHAVVALLNPNFTIVTPPDYYYVKHYSELENFIVNFGDKIENETITRVVNFLQDYSNEILYKKGDLEG